MRYLLAPLITALIWLPTLLPQALEVTQEKPKAEAERILELYPAVDFAKLAEGKWKRPRARILGTVKTVQHERDGDIHIALVNGGHLVVLEIIPELKITPPKKGDMIQAWGIVREDGWHGWWELHPLVGWELVK